MQRWLNLQCFPTAKRTVNFAKGQKEQAAGSLG